MLRPRPMFTITVCVRNGIGQARETRGGRTPHAPGRRMTGDPASPGSPAEPSKVGPKPRPAGLGRRIRSLVRAIQENDDAKIEQAILHLSSSRRVFAPLALAIGAFALSTTR